ncbi:MAG: nucleoside hydrolase-like domain-containing protein [Bacteroidota bacterium]
MDRLLFLLMFLSGLCLIGCQKPSGSVELSKAKLPAKDYRYVICTDMTHDDDNSLIRLLHYANEIDIEAIIVTEQGPETWKIEDWPNKMWNRAQDILDKYELVEDNLRKHADGFPSAGYFRSITKRGMGSAERMSGSSDEGAEHFWDYVGEGRDSDGSRFLQEVFDREDERPIYVAFWGGPITFVQATWRYEQSHTAGEVQALMDKLIFHCISFQDITFEYFIDLDSICGRFYGDYSGERLVPSVSLIDTDHFWKYIGATDVPTIHANSGVLGDLYDEGGEGDTPAFLNLISMNLGLSDISQPTWGGWGDRFIPHTLPNVWEADDPNELMRWLEAANNSFYARCKWETLDFAQVNHDPVAAFEGDTSPDAVFLTGSLGEEVSLSALGSTDPDGDALTYSWWHYPVPGSYQGEVAIMSNQSESTTLMLPQDLGDRQLHIVLEVLDDGHPSLRSYKRVVLSAKD